MVKKEKSEEILIAAGKQGIIHWRDLWEYRELFFFLAWKDILVRYKQTIFGVAWAIIQPLFTMVILTVIFQNLAQLPSIPNVPYPILVYSGLLPWMLFANYFSSASTSMVGNKNLITKVYFPRIIIPISNIIVQLVDFLISFCIFVV